MFVIFLSLYLETFLLKTLLEVAKHHHKIALTSFKTEEMPIFLTLTLASLDCFMYSVFGCL